MRLSRPLIHNPEDEPKDETRDIYARNVAGDEWRPSLQVSERSGARYIGLEETYRILANLVARGPNTGHSLKIAMNWIAIRLRAVYHSATMQIYVTLMRSASD